MKSKTVQEIQDEIFRKMPTKKKIRLTSDFFLFGRKLKKLKEQNESTRHLEDIESILKISKVDLKYIKEWIEKQSTKKIFGNLCQKKSEKINNKKYEWK